MCLKKAMNEEYGGAIPERRRIRWFRGGKPDKSHDTAGAETAWFIGLLPQTVRDGARHQKQANESNGSRVWRV
jgi:hypothetical protein